VKLLEEMVNHMPREQSKHGGHADHLQGNRTSITPGKAWRLPATLTFKSKSAVIKKFIKVLVLVVKQ